MRHFHAHEDDRNKVVSALTAVEGRSAIYRFGRRRLLSTKQVSLALDRLAQDIGRIVQQPIDAIVLEASSLLIDRYQLRSLDAIQLGCAIVTRTRFAAPDMRFIASDNELLDAAKAEGFDVWDPSA